MEFHMMKQGIWVVPNTQKEVCDPGETSSFNYLITVISASGPLDGNWEMDQIKILCINFVSPIDIF